MQDSFKTKARLKVGSTNYTIDRYAPSASSAVRQTATNTRTIDIPIGADVTILSLH